MSALPAEPVQPVSFAETAPEVGTGGWVDDLLDLVAPLPYPADPARRAPLHAVQEALPLSTSPGDQAPVIPIDRVQQREAEQRAQVVLQAAVEVVSGIRPGAQLARWVCSDVFADLRRRAHLASLTGPERRERRSPAWRPQVASLHGSFPRPGTYEVAARVRQGGRSHAVAARFDLKARSGGRRWVCTAMDFS